MHDSQVGLRMLDQPRYLYLLLCNVRESVENFASANIVVSTEVLIESFDGSGGIV